MNQDIIDILIDTIIGSDCSEHLNNPYDTFRKLRNINPLTRHSNGTWMATGFNHVKKLMISSSFGRGNMYKVPPSGENLSPVEIMRKNWLLYCDPPRHTELKNLLLQILKKQMNEFLDSRIKDISYNLIQNMLKKEKFDIVIDYAYPLPLIVIADLLGVPKEDRELFKIWSAQINKTLEPCCSKEQKKQSDKIVLNIYEYFDHLISSNITKNSMLDDLLNSDIGEGRLNKDEVIYSAMLILIAGHETTSSMTALGMLALLENPQKYKELKNNPELIINSADELLRYDPPVQMARRIALENTELKGQSIKQGDLIYGVFGSANHDDTKFKNPTMLDFTRKNLHLSFGIGTHYCLGTALAKKEGKIIFNDLITKLPFIKFDNKKFIRKNNLMLRGLESLPVAIYK